MLQNFGRGMMRGNTTTKQAADTITDAFLVLGEDVRTDLGCELVELTPLVDPMEARPAHAGGFLRLFAFHLQRDDATFSGEHSRHWLARRLASAVVCSDVDTLASTLGHSTEPWASFHTALLQLLDHRDAVVAWAMRDPRLAA